MPVTTTSSTAEDSSSEGSAADNVLIENAKKRPKRPLDNSFMSRGPH